VVETGLRLRDLLAAEGLDCWPKTTGGKGLHVMVPFEPEMDWDRAHVYTKDLAEGLAATAPDRYVTSAALKARPGRLFIDYLRNGRGTTAVGAYSPRPRLGFPVAAPVTGVRLSTDCGRNAFSIRKPPRAIALKSTMTTRMTADSCEMDRPDPSEEPNPNTDTPWSSWEDQGIRWGLDHNQSIEEIADFVCRTPSEVRQRIGRSRRPMRLAIRHCCATG
jgi:DNA primase